MTKRIALVRGINVGGKNLVAMKDLVAIFQEAGCADVTTYIQSGNVLFNAKAARMKTLAKDVTAAIEARSGCTVEVIFRSADELRAVLGFHPFAKKIGEPKQGHVVFLGVAPDPRAIEKLDPKRSPPDEFFVKDKEIYLFTPNGAGQSKLTNDWFERVLGTRGTSRNVRTIEKLIDLAGS